MGCLLAAEAGSVQPSHLSPRAAISAPFPSRMDAGTPSSKLKLGNVRTDSQDPGPWLAGPWHSALSGREHAGSTHTGARGN